MDLTFSNTWYVPRQAPRGKIAVFDCREHPPLDRFWTKANVPPFECILMPARSIWMGEAREEGDWNGQFVCARNLVEAGVVIQPLPWMPGLCFQIVNLSSWGLQVWPGCKFGELITAPLVREN